VASGAETDDVVAEDRGKAVVGVAHLLDHVDAMDDGRLDGRAVPRISRPSPAAPAPPLLPAVRRDRRPARRR
jgi:hypothetical protein